MTPASLFIKTRRSPAQVYHEMDLSSRVESATPHALVTILYAELGTALAVFDRALAARDTAQSSAHYARAASILRALSAGLDRDKGGALAASLTAIYAQMQARLIAARDGDARAVADLRDGVANLAAAWAQIAGSLSSRPDICASSRSASCA